MKFTKILLPISMLCIFSVGCNKGLIDNPAPKDFLSDDSADIFLLGGIVYSNAQDVDWVSDLEYQLGEQIGEITKITDKAGSFKNGTANILPVGTKIYETDTPAYIANVDGEEIPYLKQIEG
ncbi:hypothetical protein B14911_16285 [Bacillus sp. NRRL B-14911]|uniref:Uncharacterized protein n=1 Tax=Bacillus infantis NRRL B-14911 TaxID=1367477 RepID=U5L811_9BACI|nr:MULTISPECIES: hypothetical protein [Bacillus]AGX02886.1 hypothetical protein N288_04645 [Bacillus infantis NRRL B-14911]EAR67088.1 hypothetical protein B14911_16285 [Bacillus sp. NRRL B-14911]